MDSRALLGCRAELLVDQKRRHFENPLQLVYTLLSLVPVWASYRWPAVAVSLAALWLASATYSGSAFYIEVGEGQLEERGEVAIVLPPTQVFSKRYQASVESTAMRYAAIREAAAAEAAAAKSARRSTTVGSAAGGGGRPASASEDHTTLRTPASPRPGQQPPLPSPSLRPSLLLQRSQASSGGTDGGTPLLSTRDHAT